MASKIPPSDRDETDSAEGSAGRPYNTAPANPSIDFKSIAHLLVEKAWLVVLCVLLGAGITAWRVDRAPRLFKAVATLQVDTDEQRVVRFEKVQQEDTRGPEMLMTIEQTLKARPVLARVLLTNNLATDPEFVSPLNLPSQDVMLNQLANLVDVRLRRGTRLIDVTVVHTSPRIAEKIANSVVKQFIRANADRYSESSLAAQQFLVDEAERLKKRLHNSEQALFAYKEATKSVSLEDKQDIVTAKLKELSTRTVQARGERIRIEVQQTQVSELGSNVAALSVLPIVQNDPSVSGLRASVSKLENEFATLQSRYRDQHPKYIEAEKQLTIVRQALTNAILDVPQTLAAAYQSAKSAEQALDRELADQETLSLALNKQAIGYGALSREVQSDRSLFESVLSRLKETNLTKELETTKIRVVQDASIPGEPFSPDKKKMWMQGLLAALALGVAIVLIWDRLDSSLKSVDQAEEFLSLPVLGTIPAVRPKAVKARHSVVISDNTNTHGAEAFRTLRTSLRMLGPEPDRRVFLFTSAVPKEGKTFTSINFAMTLSQQGLKTLLIDGDLRRPAVEKDLLGHRSKHLGVSDYLVGHKSLDDLIQSTEYPNLAILSTGTPAPNPAELLGGGGWDTLIDDVSKRYDRIVIDSAPIHAVSDTLLMLKRVQTICLLVRAHSTPRRLVQRAVQLLQSAGGSVNGIVLNRVKPGGLFGSYSPYYYADTRKYAEKGVYGA